MRPSPGSWPSTSSTLRGGLLRIFLDQDLVVEQRLTGQASKIALIFTVRKGSYKDVLEVQPGRHAIRVKVAWDDNERSERIVGTFKPGATRHLQVRLGRLRKNLSLEWEWGLGETSTRATCASLVPRRAGHSRRTRCRSGP